MTYSRTTVEAITQYLSSFFPPKLKDVAFEYHVPRVYRAPIYVKRVVLSITPTEGFYSALHRPCAVPPLGFLHRPFDLDRKRVKRGSTVLSSHVAFDEVLTVGWNVALAHKLGIVGGAECLSGYKNDPDRKIGLIARIESTTCELAHSIHTEFQSSEAVFGVASSPIKVIAIMNAFHEDEVQRVLELACSNEWVTHGSQILYLTGAVRLPGLEAALQRGMSGVCVGHRSCEEWGIRYLASQVQQQFPSLEVDVILEEKPPRAPKVNPQIAEGGSKANKPAQLAKKAVVQM